jgi:hypothetical protein
MKKKVETLINKKKRIMLDFIMAFGRDIVAGKQDVCGTAETKHCPPLPPNKSGLFERRSRNWYSQEVPTQGG